MSNRVNVYVGTYTKSKSSSQGIYMLQLDPVIGKLTAPQLAGQTQDPSFLAVHPNGRLLYAVNEVQEFNGQETGAVSAFAMDEANGKLSLLNQQPSGGAAPCHIEIDAAGKYALVANYGGGSVEVLPIREDGRLSEPVTRIQHKDPEVGAKPRSSRCHSIHLDTSQRFAFVTDLGLDRVFQYRFDRQIGSLAPNDPAAVVLSSKTGPRHFAWHPSNRFAYVINEPSSSMTALAYDPDRGTLSPLQTLSTLPPDFHGTSDCAEVQVHPSGRFVYGSNRGHDSIAMFAVEERSGKLKPLGHESTQGQNPRHFGIDPTGRYMLVANQDSSSIVVFRIDSQTGLLSPTGQKVEVPMPVCVKFVQAARSRP